MLPFRVASLLTLSAFVLLSCSPENGTLLGPDLALNSETSTETETVNSGSDTEGGTESGTETSDPDGTETSDPDGTETSDPDGTESDPIVTDSESTETTTNDDTTTATTDSDEAEPTTDVRTEEPVLAYQLLACPIATGQAAEDEATEKGKKFGVGKNAISIPEGALSQAQAFRVSVPASDFLEVRVSPRGGGGFQFNAPVEITLDYGRCDAALFDDGPITVYKIDPVTKEFIEHKGGIDDKASRTITFETDNLSTFSIARAM
jgi:hypothetical protein